MAYLLDTNVVSDLEKPNCDPALKAFMQSISHKEQYICTVTIGEICAGVERLPESKKKETLSQWLHNVIPVSFDGRLIDMDLDVMMAWGRILVETKRTLPVTDSMIAAAALSQGLTLLTRNTKDFAQIQGLKLFSPWGAP
jgi:predicted nucleic acid-binding protein